MTASALPHTAESPAVNELFQAIRAREPRVTFLGSVGLTTELPRSYHRSWEDSPHTDGYSTHYWGDRHRLRGKQGYSCALDLGFSADLEALMVRYTGRLHSLAITHPKAFWTHGLREFAGTVDNVNTFGWDCTSHQRTFGWASSHLTHIHLSLNRRLVTDTRRLVRIAEVFGD